MINALIANAKIKFILLVFAILLLHGCSSDLNKDKIVGEWETVVDEDKFKPERFESVKLKVILKFNTDLTLNSQMIRNDKIEGTYFGTYDFENNQEDLVIYREGKKSRKNVAKIVKLTKENLTLVDISGSGDTLHLIKI